MTVVTDTPLTRRVVGKPRVIVTRRLLPSVEARMAELSDGVIVLPGGFGTLDEAFEIITWNQLGLVAVPVVFLDAVGYFGALFEFIERSVVDGFVSDGHARSVLRADTVAETLRLATSAPAAFAPKWLG